MRMIMMMTMLMMLMMLKRENKKGWRHARLNEANPTLMRTLPFLFDHFALELISKTIPTKTIPT